jgi:alpha-tubulin suppressor-like RCC1 family protein
MPILPIWALCTPASATDTTTTTTFAWGSNDDAEVGPVAPFDRTWAEPVRNNRHKLFAIDASPGWTYNHVIAVREDSTIVTWGDNERGQAGIGTSGGNVTIPQEIRIVGGWMVAAGGQHNLVLTTAGEVWAWGDNRVGQLGTGSSSSMETLPVLVKLPMPALAIGATWSASAAVLSDGTVWTWGSDTWEELGDGYGGGSRSTPMQIAALPDRAVALSGGENHFLALLANGAVVGWGDNYENAVCSGQAAVPLAHTPAVIEDWSQPMKGLVEISAGTDFSLMRHEDGTVYGCGRNDTGQLPGISGITGRATPLGPLQGAIDVEAGHFAGLARTADADVVAWGACGYGTCGTGTGLADPWHVVLTPERVPHLQMATAIAVGGSAYAIADTPGTDLYATGGNASGQLGDGTYNNQGTPIYLTRAVVGVAGAYEHTLAVTSAGTVVATGLNDHGQLGDGSTYDTNYLVQTKLDDVVAVAAGTQFSMALRRDGTVWTWGSNAYGQLGIGSVGGDKYESVRADIDDVVAIAAGHYHAVALRADGTVWLWGDVSLTELGSWNTSAGTGGVPTQAILDPMVGISAGWAHTLALDEKGLVWSFGSNDTGQLGHGSVDPWYTDTPPAPAKIERVTDIAAGGWLSMATLWDYSVVRWGDHIDNPRYLECVPESGYGDGTPQALGLQGPALDIAAGWCHGLAMLERGEVWGFGSGRAGELGDGSWSDSIQPLQMKISEVDAIGPTGVHSHVLGHTQRSTCVPPDPRCW